MNDLESKTNSRIVNGLKKIGVGLSYTCAAIASIPLGAFRWAEEDQSQRIKFQIKLGIDGEPIARRENYQNNRPNIFGYIKNTYRELTSE